MASEPSAGLACPQVRIFSSYLKQLDGKCATPWGAAAKFGTLLYEWEAHGWARLGAAKSRANPLLWRL